MKIALVVTDKFKDYKLLEVKLDELKVKVLLIKYPAEDNNKMKHLTEEEIMRLAFEKEI